LNNNGKSVSLNRKSSLEKKLFNSFGSGEMIVVSDNEFNNLKENNELEHYYSYNITNQKDGEEFHKKVLKVTEKYPSENEKRSSSSYVFSYYQTFKDEFTSSGIMVFIGVFVGLVFLVCTGSVIFFKLLSEAQDEAPRYTVLNKIGVDEGDIKSSVYKQVGFNFFLPLLLGGLHSIVANYVVCYILGQNLSIVMLWTLIPYSIIYITYYLITTKFYFNIVTKQN
ncbi:hypothetical protein DVA85_23100, partial [Acinetobacter sp. RIT592]